MNRTLLLDDTLDGAQWAAKMLAESLDHLYSNWGVPPARGQIAEARRVIANAQRALADADSKLVDLAASLPPEE